jgi:hypothetical protein
LRELKFPSSICEEICFKKLSQEFPNEREDRATREILAFSHIFSSCHALGAFPMLLRSKVTVAGL